MFGLGFSTVTLAQRPHVTHWSPEALAPIAWYDPSDRTTLFQDAEMTQPVSADGDPVAAMRDKSGHGRDLVQSIATRRPLYRTDGTLHWLDYDGVDDALSVAQLPFTTEATVGLAFSAASNASGYPPILRNGTAATDGSGRQPMIYLDASAPDVIKTWWGNRGLAVTMPSEIVAMGPLALISAISGGVATLEVNGVGASTTGVSMTHDPAGNFALGLAGFQGRLYGAVICDRSQTPEANAALAAYLATAAGI
ncbi:hypothetical protein [Thioclava atlantica]|uniref:Uncharacterized protein n=1 Tax=Thioclava atlantica TaxID=1317124 RepID=A0A085TXX7_9RHOB|nr:hypothetical protein [Thioclava atlantica]KFE35574.1 hypothetical protein DW2_06418 [Thioclava atlantica]